MQTDASRVVLKKDMRVFVDGADTGWKWNKISGWRSEYVLWDDSGKRALSHYNRKVFVLKVLDFHNGCGEFG